MASIAEAEPAELIFAYDAGHMVATFIFLDFSPTNWAEADTAMLGNPAFELFVHVLFAC
jgi:hypothetical protein